LGIIHCDLKPENILIFPNNASQVKVIDFGSSCLESERIYFYIQSRFYRAPEVIFDLGYNYEIDMWSLGCILYELYKGEPLFPGINEIEQIYLIMEKIGFPPKYIIEHSPKKMLFFDDNLKPYQLIDEDGNYIIPGGKKIKDIMKEAPKSFVDFISKCLKWNPFERITPDKALMHPFIIENMNGAELYKHKLKVKHIKYGIKYNCGDNNIIINNNENEECNNFNNVNSTRNKDYNNINLYQNHYQYYNKNSKYNKYTKEVQKYRGNSCQTKRYKNNNINTIKNSINNFNINNFEEIKYINTTQNGSENDFNKKGNKKQSYSVTYGNSNGNNYCNMFNKKKKEKNLPLSTEIDENIRRINITENNEGGGGYKRMNKYKEKNNKYYKNKLPKHLPKKKSLGRIKNSNVKKQKNFYK
jgi:serine/threonine protein kinase